MANLARLLFHSALLMEGDESSANVKSGQDR